MTHPICIFEDSLCSQLFPLTLTRPVFDLRCGILTLKEKIIREFHDRSIILFCRSYLKDFIQQENPAAQMNKVDSDLCLFINGRVIVDLDLVRTFECSQERIFLHRGEIVAAFVRGSNVTRFIKSIDHDSHAKELINVDKVELDGVNFINYPWDLVHQNPAEIGKDFDRLNKGGVIEGVVSEKAILLNRNNIHIGPGSSIKAGAILDAEKGPIHLGKNVTIMSNAVLEGPVCVGDNSVIKIGAKIYEGTSIGEVCKVGGEVEESIIHSFSNKQHDGFLGHAYLGQWVNLGADTNNSDLKNNYGAVKVYVDGRWVDSGSMFVGLFMGDHSKSGINTMFNTGTVVGTMCNVFSSGFPPKYIPSFSWGGSDGMVEHELEKAIETARQVMARRKQDLSPEYERIFRHLFESTHSERVQYQKP